jgi:hypothetical protein
VLCLASGALTLVPIISLRGLQLLFRVRAGRREWAGLAIQLVATIAAIVSLPARGPHGSVTLPSTELFTSAMWTLIEWPLPTAWWAPILIYFPLLILFGVVCVRRPAVSDSTWMCLTVGSWALVQLVCFAYGRTFAPLASRYLDVLLVGIVASFAASFRLMVEYPARMAASSVVGVATFVWVAVIAYYLVNGAILHLPAEIADKRETGLIETANVRAFQQSGDASVFGGKPRLHVPYPVPDRLVALLQDPTIRSLLPEELGGVRFEARAKLVFRGKFASTAASFKTHLLQSPTLLLSGSLALFVFAAFVAARRRPASFTTTQTNIRAAPGGDSIAPDAWSRRIGMRVPIALPNPGE